jgi:hypothetical protein
MSLNHIEILKKMIEFCKIYYSSIELQLNDKISDINNIINEFNNTDIFFDKYPHILQEYQMLFGDFIIPDNEIKLNKLTKFINSLEILITDLCNHIFVYDLIDINPDRSQTIQYCIKCHKTKC